MARFSIRTGMESMKLSVLSLAAGLAVLVAVSTISLTGGARGGATASAFESAPTHVDSIFPIEEEVRRFRAAIGAPVAALSGGAESRDALVSSFRRALAAKDRAALASLLISVEEFAFLYYPHTKYTAKPYEMAPGLVWFQLDSYGERGLDRAITRFGDTDSIGDGGHRCPEEALSFGDGFLWSGCVLEIADGAGGVAELTLFGEILELGGEFKFVSYGNGL